MHNINKALIMIDRIGENILPFRIGYNIYLYKNFIDKYNTTINEVEGYSFFKYQNDVNNFKDLIKKAIVSYNEFMFLLLECKGINNNNNFVKMNKIGQQIISYKNEIEEFIKNVKSIKNNHNEIIKLYSEYSKIILNDKDNNNINMDYCEIDNLDNNKIDYFNLNTNIFKETDSLYLLISGNKKNLGEIIDCSNNFSKIVGYHKNELIEKNINILIPEIFQNKHNLILLEQSQKDKMNFFEKLTNKNEYKPNSIEKEIYCVTKTKFLMPITIKIYPAKTGENQVFYVVNISFKNINEPKNLKFCVLTDKNFLTFLH
jgi:PAS domain S-box-containing protein